MYKVVIPTSEALLHGQTADLFDSKAGPLCLDCSLTYRQGSAYLLQGCYVDHKVETFESQKPRVSIVTSLNPQ